MGTFKHIICFANSHRRGGRCVVGREMLEDGAMGGWIRPVGDRETEIIEAEECQYPGGIMARVMDIVRIPLASPKPNRHQRENWVIAPEPWQKIGRYKYSQALSLIENGYTDLWHRPEKDYMTDRVADKLLDHIKRSVVLIKPEKLILSFNESYLNEEKKRNPRRATFIYQSTEFHLGCTDPTILWENPIFLDQLNRRFQNDPPLLCVSLGALFEKFAYKIVAAVIYPNAKGE
ncbi:MAG: hypothetical protein QM537_08725 [Candidatus Symbiobacter sp.]|nr:hypothetical protein [Candidatus Symbiobacter sp.]